MRRRNVVLIIIAAVLLIAGILILTFLPEPEPESDVYVPPPPEAGFGNLIFASHLNTESVLMMPLNGGSYTLQIDRAETEYLKFDLIADNVIFPGMQPVMYTIFSQAITLLHLPLVTEDADDDQLALYGLDAPILTWRVNFSDGASEEFALGLRLAVGSGFYIRNAESRDVYVLDIDAAGLLLMNIEDIYDIFFFPYPPSGDQYETWDLIDYLLLERPGDETIEMRRRGFEEWYDSPFGVTRYHISQPFNGDGSEEIIKSIIMEPVTNLIPERIVAIGTTNLAFYGLDTPARLTVSTEGWEGTLLIGDHSYEYRGRYIMIEGYDAVLLDPHGNYGFLDLDPAQLRSQMTWIHHIDHVSSVEFDLGGITRTLYIDHPDPGSDDKLNGRLDDIEIGETNTRRLYASAMNISVSGGSEEPIPDESPVYRFTMNFINGEKQVLNFYRISDSEFLMVLNNESLNVYTTRLQLQIGLLNKFDILDAGGELPRG